jgi:hypothetical protein
VWFRRHSSAIIPRLKIAVVVVVVVDVATIAINPAAV